MTPLSLSLSYTLAPLVMHPQSMNGLRRSFLCRVKRGGSSHPSPDSTSRESSILVSIYKLIKMFNFNL